MNISVIVPAYNPDNKLIEVIEALIKKDFDDIIIVNDGSGKEYLEPFKRAAEYKQCTILEHDVNRGKGRGLKTAFDYCIKNRPDIDGVITVDGDNQHRADDIYNCCCKMIECKDKVILGVRNFSGKDVPARSRMGNNMTSFVFRFACGIKISDTQTGLRAIPRQYLELMMEVKGERYEYETNMLLQLKQNYIEIAEVPITTVYIEENASSHFNPIKDSLKIYAVIVKFLLSSLMSCVIDLSVFGILESFVFTNFDTSTKILLSTAIARGISSVFNYTFNRKAVFKSDSGVVSSFVKYYILCVCQLCVSYGLVYMVTKILSLGAILTVLAKAVIDTCLFLVSFQIQRRWVFKNNRMSK